MLVFGGGDKLEVQKDKCWGWNGQIQRGHKTRGRPGKSGQTRGQGRGFNVIYKSWGPWDLKEERSIICFVPGGLSEAKQPTRLEFGVEKYLLQDHASRLVSQASLKPLLARF